MIFIIIAISSIKLNGSSNIQKKNVTKYIMPLNSLERKKKLAQIRTNIWRARIKGDTELIDFLEKKRAQLKKT